MEDNQLIGNKTRRTLPEGALGGNKEGGSQLLDSQLPCGQTTFSTANENAHQEVDDLNDLLSFPILKSIPHSHFPSTHSFFPSHQLYSSF